MDFDELKAKRITGLKESIKFFSNNAKPDRERWIIDAFLKVLGVGYSDMDIICNDDRFPDCIFKGSDFEITELYTEGRRRLDEFKLRLQKWIDAKGFSDLSMMMEDDSLDCYHHEHSSPDILKNKLVSAANKQIYSSDVKKRTNLLVYVNLTDHRFSPDDIHGDILMDPAFNGWLSVSVLFNKQAAIVVWAGDNAPEYLKSIVGEVIFRKDD